MSAELDYPAWPPGLTDQTPLPFMYWRVMHVVDGRRSIEKLSTTLGLKEPQLRQALTEVRNWLGRAAVREQPLTGELEKALRQALVSVVGPMGELMIDDALDDLPEQTTLSALVSSLNTQLSEPHSQALARILRSRGIA
ncbi:hypothetical protein [Deinococcus aquiradiocola]|uniref:DUF8082 domain-containing protein n=1 Tax=Deinococcus aquiradiocola TaxID=393059 RepID=A0A917PL76_9DEIO|nr:hypothetical protein [Deinococcus aquiradiocola]GGJ82967.1 hypothetical protein GCM10008939_28610 [Deinococcus aquiradiocola]